MPPGEWWAGGGPRDAAPACTIVRPEEPGERLILSGTVYVRDGRIPLSGVTVYVYQTDVHGLYNPEGKFGVPHRIRGWANTTVTTNSTPSNPATIPIEQRRHTSI